MTSLPSPRQVDAWPNRRIVGLMLGVVAELLLLGALAYAAWGGEPSEYKLPLSLEDGLTVIALFGGVGSVLVFAATACLVATKRQWGPMLATVLLAGAGVVGFVGFALISFSRQEVSDC